MNGKISLKAARVNAGLTQKELAKKIGKSEATIIKWERDTTGRYLTVENLEKICKILGTNPGQIFFE